MTNGNDGSEHLEALGNLSSVLVDQKNIKALNDAKVDQDIIKVMTAKVKAKEVSTSNDGHYDVVGITACPTGIAHTYLAQEKIIEYAKKLGLTAKVETQGRRGTENKLSQEDVDNAKVIFLAHDKALTGLGRFNGKKVVETGTKDAIFKGDKIIEEALKGEGLKEIHSNAKDDGDTEMSLKKFKDVKGNLLAGVSRMLPFVVAGGIVLGIGFLIDFAAGAQGGGNFGTNNAAAG
ncbi:hypothetical protein Zmor_012243 [Zophobas morio]|uniref:PTS EIIB type-2 domain-containing protein n=1 Tax=Zophobas morio TaxID=2755281 RepID=A0AA38LYF0_9CUCU|nr:hypothetical protein Zmor_012243 [Zophobas morio]